VRAEVASAEALSYEREFDAVFSNATLHWVRDVDGAIAAVHRALKTGGRFVAEFGGEGCVAGIREALAAALARRGLDFARLNPWYFPSAREYGARLQRGGFEVETIAVFPRPTPLPGEMKAWLGTFALTFTGALPPDDREAFLSEVQEALRPSLRGADGTWTADYTRLRFRALKRES
jgi:SAM-dependent methyltransferase